MNRKKKINLVNVSDYLSDSEMKQVKGLGWDGGGWWTPPDWVSCCEANELRVTCSNGFGQSFSACMCDAVTMAGIEYGNCVATTHCGISPINDPFHPTSCAQCIFNCG